MPSVDRIKRLSMEVLGKHKPRFGRDFSDNKKALDEVTIIRSKGLKNEIAGYITKHIKREVHDSELRRAQSAQEEQAVAEKVSEESAPVAVEAATETPEPEPAEPAGTAEPAEAATEAHEPAEAATEAHEPAEAATQAGPEPAESAGDAPEPAEAATETPAAEPEPEQTS